MRRPKLVPIHVLANVIDSIGECGHFGRRSILDHFDPKVILNVGTGSIQDTGEISSHRGVEMYHGSGTRE